VDNNLGKTKVNIILPHKLIIPDTNANPSDRHYQFIVDMKEFDGQVCGWEESSVNIEGKATLFCYRNHIAAV
jgi:hypothetical protein